MIFTRLTLNKLTDNPEVNGKSPSHSIYASDSEFKNKTRVGAMWLKEATNGKFLSGELNKANRKYQKQDGTEVEEKAYVLITLDEYNELVASKSEVKTGGYNGEVASTDLPDFEF